MSITIKKYIEISFLITNRRNKSPDSLEQKYDMLKYFSSLHYRNRDKTVFNY